MDIKEIRAHFPILQEAVEGKHIVYLDNAATSQKPIQVIEAMDEYYKLYNANVHRGVHFLSRYATDRMEEVREKLVDFLNAGSIKEVIFTRGTTEGINLVASSWGRANLNAGDKILVSRMEHHSNIVPWQLIAEERGAEVVPINVLPDGSLDMEDYKSLLDDTVKLVSVNHISNALGTINPVKEIVKLAKEKGITVLIDGAQAAGHVPLDVQDLGADFYVLSAHKMCGPTGMGVLWGREEVLNAMPPYHGGGEMIESVSFEGTTFNELPFKFEAGTPDIAGIIGLGAAVDYLNSLDRQALIKWEDHLTDMAMESLGRIQGFTPIGTAEHKTSVISFNLGAHHPFDVGTLLDHQDVAVRTGHHCTQPLMAHFGIAGTVRASFAFYNNEEDVEKLLKATQKAAQMLG